MKRNTACECEHAGWCARHQQTKGESDWRLCQFSPLHFERWERGEETSRNNGNSLSKTGTKNHQADTPTVAVIIISHNYGKYLVECLQSVLDQTLRPNEILVVDDASSDDTAIIAESFLSHGVDYAHVDYRNVHRSRQRGFELTTAEILCFLDADDILSPDYLEEGLRHFSNPHVGVVYSDCQLFGTSSEFICYPEHYSLAALERENFIHAGSLARRVALELSQSWKHDIDPRIALGDWFLWRRILRDNWVAVKQSSVYHYRRHKQSWSTTSTAYRSAYFNKAALDLENISLFIPLSGRIGLWPELTRFLTQNCWPHHQIHLTLLDTSQNPEFSREVRNWLAKCNYLSTSYHTLTVGSQRLANCDRHQVHIRDQVRQAMARIYNYLSRLPATEYVWFLEDDIIPPADACRRLLEGFEGNVASVAAPYRSRYHGGFCVWNDSQNHLHSPGAGFERVRGNGFGCAIIRKGVLREAVFTSSGPFPDFDHAFYEWLHGRGFEARVCWDAECLHLDSQESHIRLSTD